MHLQILLEDSVFCVGHIRNAEFDLRVLYTRESSEEHYLQILYLDLRTIFGCRLFKCSGQGTLAVTSVYPAVTSTNQTKEGISSQQKNVSISHKFHQSHDMG